MSQNLDGQLQRVRCDGDGLVDGFRDVVECKQRKVFHRQLGSALQPHASRQLG